MVYLVPSTCMSQRQDISIVNGDSLSKTGAARAL
jgi:hypothetical protein